MVDKRPPRPRTGPDEIAIYNKFTNTWRVVPRFQKKDPLTKDERAAAFGFPSDAPKPKKLPPKVEASLKESIARVEARKDKPRERPVFSLADVEARRTSVDVRGKQFKEGFEDPVAKRSVFLPGKTEEEIKLEQKKAIIRRIPSKITKTVTKKKLTPAEIKEVTEPGFLRAAVKPKDITEKLRTFRRKLIQGIEKERFKDKGFTKTAKNILKGTVVAGALGGVQGILEAGKAIKNPVKFVKNQVEALKQPKKTFKALAHEFSVDPAGVIAEFYVFGKTLHKVGQTAKRSPVGRLALEELYIAKQPIELRASIRAIIKSSKTQEALNPGKLEAVKTVDFAEVKTLNTIEAAALKKTLQQVDSAVFGSLASRTLSKKKTPIPHDVDLATADITKFGNTFIENIPKALRKNYRMRGEKLINVNTGNALLDVKPLDRLIPQRSIFTKKGYIPVSGFVDVLEAPKGSILPRLKKKAVTGALEVPTQRLKTVEGIKLTSFGEQTLRKGLGTIQVLIEKNVRRAKDPQSFIIGLEAQLNSLKKAKPTNIASRLINKRRINSLQNALKVLKSEDFARILDKKIPSLTKDFPILEKFSKAKIREAIERNKKIATDNLIFDKKGNIVDIKTGKTIKKASELPSKLPSKLPASKLPSRLPSKLTSSDISSIVPPSKITIIPSRVPIKPTISQIITNINTDKSIIPVQPSKLKTPESKIIRSFLTPSELKKVPPSKVPPIKVKLTKVPFLPPDKVKKLKEFLEELKEKKKKGKLNLNRLYLKYTPTLAGLGKAATRTTGKFTGFELRGSVIKPVSVKKYKKRGLKNKRFVRKHRRRKPRRK